MMEKLEIICIESEAFFILLELGCERLKAAERKPDDKWVSPAEVMLMLRIKSKTTLQKLRDEVHIRFTQPDKKIILYDTGSIKDYLEDFVYEPFDLAGTQNGKVKDIPIMLLSAEANITGSFDSTGVNFFDFVFSKESVSEVSNQIRLKLIALASGYEKLLKIDKGKVTESLTWVNQGRRCQSCPPKRKSLAQI